MSERNNAGLVGVFVTAGICHSLLFTVPAVSQAFRDTKKGDDAWALTTRLCGQGDISTCLFVPGAGLGTGAAVLFGADRRWMYERSENVAPRFAEYPTVANGDKTFVDCIAGRLSNFSSSLQDPLPPKSPEAAMARAACATKGIAPQF